MEHHEIEEQLTAYLLGDLAPKQADAIRQHLDGCADCRALAKELEPTLDLLRGALAVDLDVPERLDEVRKREIFAPREAPARMIWLTRNRQWVMRAAGVAALVLVLVGLIVPTFQPAVQHSRTSADHVEKRQEQVREQMGTFDEPAGPGSQAASFSDLALAERPPAQAPEPSLARKEELALGDRFKIAEGADQAAAPRPFGVDDSIRTRGLSGAQESPPVFETLEELADHDRLPIPRTDAVEDSGTEYRFGQKVEMAAARIPSEPDVAGGRVVVQERERIDSFSWAMPGLGSSDGEAAAREFVGRDPAPAAGTASQPEPEAAAAPRPAVVAAKPVTGTELSSSVSGRGPARRVAPVDESAESTEIGALAYGEKLDVMNREARLKQVDELSQAVPDSSDDAVQDKPLSLIRGERFDTDRKLALLKANDGLEDQNQRASERLAGLRKGLEDGYEVAGQSGFGSNGDSLGRTRTAGDSVDADASEVSREIQVVRDSRQAAPAWGQFEERTKEGRELRLNEKAGGDAWFSGSKEKKRLAVLNDLETPLGWSDSLGEVDLPRMEEPVAEDAAEKSVDVDGDSIGYAYFGKSMDTSGTTVSSSPETRARRAAAPLLDAIALADEEEKESESDFVEGGPESVFRRTEAEQYSNGQRGQLPPDMPARYEPESGRLTAPNTAQNLQVQEPLTELQLGLTRPAGLEEAAPESSEPETELVARAYGVNLFVETTAEPFSTFAIDVDTAAYTLTRKHIQSGVLPPAEAVRTEEFVNFFDYGYRAPERKTFAVYTTVAPTPFGDGQLLKIGVKGKRLGREEQRPAVLTFVIDTSGSMDTPGRLGLVRDSLQLLLDELGEADRVALVQVDTQARLLLAHTPVTERAAIENALRQLQCSGSTHLEQGITLGYEVAAQAFTGGAVNRVLLLSDGAANLGSADAEQILSMVESHRDQGIFCSVFGFGIGAYNDEMLEQLANKGDGAYRFIDSREEARRVFVDDLAATLHVIASDVKIQVEFFPDQVTTYRQLGYENRQLTREQFRDDTVDAGEVGSGESVTALYELMPGAKSDRPLGVVRVRYRDVATGSVEEIAHPIRRSDEVARFEEAGSRFRLAAAAAEFAEILRGSPFAEDSDYAAVVDVLRPVALDLRLDQRVQELLQLVQHAPGLPRAGGN